MNEFPHIVTFQTYTEVPDGLGGYTETWADLFTTEAHVQPINGEERVSAQKLTNPVDHNIFYPYQDGVKGDMRAKWLDRTKEVDGAEVPLTLELRSDPLDQGGMGEILLVKAQLK